MDEKQEVQNGSVVAGTPALRDLDRDTCVSVVREIEATTLGSLPEPAIVAAVSILSTGAVAALLLFEYLSFLHPDTANQFIPLVVGAVVPLVVKAWVDHKNAKKVAK